MQLTRQQERNVMLSSAEEIQLLQNIVQVTGARKTLDIGSYIVVCTVQKTDACFCIILCMNFPCPVPDC